MQDNQTGNLDDIVEHTVLSSDRTVPDYVMREYPFPGRKNVLVSGLDALLKIPVVWGLIGGGICLGANLSGTDNIFSDGSLEKSIRFFVSGIKSFTIPYLAGLGVREVIGGISFIQEDRFGEHEDFTEKIDFKKGIKDFIKSDTSIIFRKTGFRGSNDLNSYLRLLEAEENSLEHHDTSGFFELCHSSLKAGRDINQIGRLFHHMQNHEYLKNQRSKAIKKTGQDPTNIIPKIKNLVLDYVYGSYDKLITRVDEIGNNPLRQAVLGDEIVDVSYDVNFFIASLLRSVSKFNPLYRKAAKLREPWFWEMAFMFAKEDPEWHFDFPVQSKNKVYLPKSTHPTKLVSYKQFQDKESCVGQIELTKMMNDVIESDEFLVPEPITYFEHMQGNESSFVLAEMFIRGETLFEKIQQKNLGKYVEKTLEFMALVQGKVLPEGLEQRDYVRYITEWAERAGVLDRFENGDLTSYFQPIQLDYDNSCLVTCFDFHPMNIITQEGKIGKIDNELTRKLPIQAEQVKFFELFPFLPKLEDKPGDKDDREFSRLIEGHLMFYNDASGRKIVFDDDYYRCYLNSVLELGLTLYSPYTERKDMQKFKRNLLYKGLNTLEVMKVNFSHYYEDNMMGYTGLKRVFEKMIELNGF